MLLDTIKIYRELLLGLKNVSSLDDESIVNGQLNNCYVQYM